MEKAAKNLPEWEKRMEAIRNAGENITENSGCLPHIQMAGIPRGR